jgi:hypothetical protein
MTQAQIYKLNKTKLTLSLPNVFLQFCTKSQYDKIKELLKKQELSKFVYLNISNIENLKTTDLSCLQYATVDSNRFFELDSPVLKQLTGLNVENVAKKSNIDWKNIQIQLVQLCTKVLLPSSFLESQKSSLKYLNTNWIDLETFQQLQNLVYFSSCESQDEMFDYSKMTHLEINRREQMCNFNEFLKISKGKFDLEAPANLNLASEPKKKSKLVSMTISTCLFEKDQLKFFNQKHDRLQHFFCPYTFLTAKSATVFCENLLLQLKTLSISISNDSLLILTEFLPKSSLQSLSLTNSILNKETSIKFNDALSKTTSITHLTLSNVCFHESNKLKLQNMPQLTFLKLPNMFNSIDWETKINLPNLVELDLSNNDSEIWSKFGLCFPYSFDDLERLRMFWTSPTSDDLNSLARRIPLCKKLKYIGLRRIDTSTTRLFNVLIPVVSNIVDVLIPVVSNIVVQIDDNTIL